MTNIESDNRGRFQDTKLSLCDAHQQIPDATSYALVYIEAIILGMLAAGMPAYFAMDHTRDREVTSYSRDKNRLIFSTKGLEHSENIGPHSHISYMFLVTSVFCFGGFVPFADKVSLNSAHLWSRTVSVLVRSGSGGHPLLLPHPVLHVHHPFLLPHRKPAQLQQPLCGGASSCLKTLFLCNTTHM